MDLDELQTVRDTERSKDSLQHLSDSFYTDVAEHIEELKATREECATQADDPFDDPEVQRLTGEIDATEQVVESIYERRVGKLVKLASFAAADMPADEEGLTAEEADLFSDLVARIKDNRAHVLDVLAGEVDREDGVEPAESPDPADESADAIDTADSASQGVKADPPDESSVSAADLMGDGSEVEPTDTPAAAGAITDESEPAANPDSGTTETELESEDEEGVERTTLRITRDVGEIVGVDDREYDLASEDVVTLPEANAGALVQREAAERLD